MSALLSHNLAACTPLKASTACVGPAWRLLMVRKFVPLRSPCPLSGTGVNYEYIYLYKGLCGLPRDAACGTHGAGSASVALGQSRDDIHRRRRHDGGGDELRRFGTLRGHLRGSAAGCGRLHAALRMALHAAGREQAVPRALRRGHALQVRAVGLLHRGAVCELRAGRRHPDV